MKNFFKIFFINIIFFIIIFTSTIKEYKIEKIINEPIIPQNNEEYIIKKYNKSKYNLNHSRYNFQEKYNKRKLFKINYSYYPYLHLKKNLTYEENALYIYNITGMLNITKLEYYYYDSFTKEKNIHNIRMLNHIHLSMALDKKYCDLSLISISSVLNTSSSDTYMHFHILGLNFGLYEIKSIINLKK